LVLTDADRLLSAAAAAAAADVVFVIDQQPLACHKETGPK